MPLFISLCHRLAAHGFAIVWLAVLLLVLVPLFATGALLTLLGDWCISAGYGVRNFMERIGNKLEDPRHD